MIQYDNVSIICTEKLPVGQISLAHVIHNQKKEK